MRELDRLARHLGFGQCAHPRRSFDDVTIAVAGGEIHLAVDAAGILAQLLLDRAHRLDEFAPVHRLQEAQAADAVADRHLVGRLLLVFRLDRQLDRLARLREQLLDPGQRQRQGGALPLQAAREFRDERTGHRGTRARHVRDHQDQALGVALGDVRHLVGPVVGAVAADPVRGDARADAPEVLDQRQAQHDGNRPQLAQLQCGDGLVGGHEAAETLGIHAPVAVRDRLQRDVVYARKPGRRPGRQARQFPAVAFRQVSPGRADLLFDQVEVVEQPFPGRRNRALRLDRCSEQIEGTDQDAFVLRQPREEPVRNAFQSQTVRARQGLAMALHLLAAEQLRAQRLFVAGETISRCDSPQPHPKARQRPANRLAARLQFRDFISSWEGAA